MKEEGCHVFKIIFYLEQIQNCYLFQFLMGPILSLMYVCICVQETRREDEIIPKILKYIITVRQNVITNLSGTIKLQSSVNSNYL